MPDLSVGPHYTIPAAELRITTSRSGGPGGQHVNTTDTRVRVHFGLANSKAFPASVRDRMVARLEPRMSTRGELVITCDSSRSQRGNLEEALQRLATLLIDAMKIRKHRRKTRPSKGAVKRRLESKKQRGATKKGRRRPQHDD